MKNRGPAITDVLVVGGGLAGLTLALQLRKRRPALDIHVIDSQRRPVPERTSTVGESLAEVGSHYIREVIGLRDHLDAQQVPKFGLRFFVGGQDDLGDRFEIGPLHPKICEMDGGRFVGLPLRTHQLDRGRLENELARRCGGSGIALLEGTRLERVEIDPAGHKAFITGDHAGALRARWIVFASGAGLRETASGGARSTTAFGPRGRGWRVTSTSGRGLPGRASRPAPLMVFAATAPTT